MIEISKTYRTRCGFPVRLDEVSGAIARGWYQMESGIWAAQAWRSIDGRRYEDADSDPYDLIEVTP